MTMLSSVLRESSSWLVVAVLAALLLAMLALLGTMRGRMHGEVSRKAAHVGLGLALVALPWLSLEPMHVLVLVTMAIVVMLAIRLVPALRERYGCVVHGVRRTGQGDLYFPLAAAVLFVVAHEDRVLYAVPMLALTLADAAAALVGLRYGRTRYETMEGRKSLEGSVACFGAAFLAAHVPLLVLTDIGRMESLLVGLGFGMLVTLIEAIAWRGLDNLLIPLGGFLLLRALLRLDLASLAALVSFVGIVTFLLVLLLALRRRRAPRAVGALARFS